jgi:hypothetical protein
VSQVIAVCRVKFACRVTLVGEMEEQLPLPACACPAKNIKGTYGRRQEEECGDEQKVGSGKKRNAQSVLDTPESAFEPAHP